MSGKKYAYIDLVEKKEYASKADKLRIMNSFSEFNKEYSFALKSCHLSDIGKLENHFSEVKNSIYYQIKPNSLELSSFHIIEKNVPNLLNSLYSELRNEIYNSNMKLIKELKNDIKDSKEKLEPKDYNMLISDADALVDMSQNIIYSKGIERGINKINLNISTINKNIEKAICYKAKLKNKVEEQEVQTNRIYKDIKELGESKTDSEAILFLQKNICQQAKELLSQKFKGNSIEDVLKYEEEKGLLLKKLYQRFIELKNKVEEQEVQTNRIYKDIKELGESKTNSEAILSLQKNICQQAKELLSQKFKGNSIEDVLKYEEETHRSLCEFYQKIKGVVNRNEIISKIEISDDIISFTDVLSKIKDFKGNCTKKQDNMKKKEKFISVINELKNKIISIGILEYQRKVTELTKNIENEPIGKLEMITGQIKFDISVLGKKFEETKFLKNNLFTLKLYTKQSSMPNSKEIELIIDELLSKPILSKDEIELIEQKVKKLKEEEKQLVDTAKLITSKKKVAEAMEDAFKKLHYKPITEIKANSVPIYIDTPWSNYKIKFIFSGKGELLIKFIRIVASNEEKINTTKMDHATDIEICKKWSKDYKKWAETLNKMGFKLKKIWQKEPEDVGVEIEVNQQLYSSELKEKKKKIIRKKSSKYMEMH